MTSPTGSVGSLALLTQLHDVVGQLPPAASVRQLLANLVALAVTRVPGAQYAGITRARDDQFETWAASDPAVDTVDALQYELQRGPCVDAIVQAPPLFRSNDLRSDDRWPLFGRLAYERTGVISMMSHQLFFDDDPDLVASLNL